jgi:tetratricopeptide (TPR) repeat protein
MASTITTASKLHKYIAVFGIILIAGIVFGLLAFTWKSGEKIVYEKNPNLTTEQQDQRNQLISELNNKIKSLELDSKASPESLYSLYTQVGAEYFVVGKFAEARDVLEKATKLILDNNVAYEQLYVVANAMKDYDAARKSIKKAIEISPASPVNWVSSINLEKDDS